MGLNEQKLRGGMNNIWLKKYGQITNDEIYLKEQVIELLIEINNEEPIFVGMPEPLQSIANSGFFTQISLIIYSKDTKDDAITGIMASVNYVNSIIDNIIEVSNTLSANYKKEAFYRLLDNQCFFLNTAFIAKNSFIFKSIDQLCEIHDIQLSVSDFSSSELLYFFMASDKYRTSTELKRTIEILMKYGDRLIIKDQNGITQSNILNIGLCREDILELKIFRSIAITDLTEFMNLMCKVMHVKIKGRENCDPIPLFNIYHSIQSLFKTPIDDILLIPKDKEEIKSHFIAIQKIESISIIWSEADRKFFEDNFNRKSCYFEYFMVLRHLKFIYNGLITINSSDSYIRFIIRRYQSAALNFLMNFHRNFHRNSLSNIVTISRKMRKLIISFFVAIFFFALMVINTAILNMINFDKRIPSILFS
ncbi:hypothetical protein NEPAR04_0867 [Nematocida parisii]|nr:hypothetical protein NEPAR08_0893 [Nematocida parisii]KAI5129031.1 hypothetical protein NEPAR03_1477 [Nematocida parisii]KAI5141305.1 hypothetical protein NEPAR04_0867 [Nematocida parisii]